MGRGRTPCRRTSKDEGEEEESNVQIEDLLRCAASSTIMRARELGWNSTLFISPDAGVKPPDHGTVVAAVTTVIAAIMKL